MADNKRSNPNQSASKTKTSGRIKALFFKLLLCGLSIAFALVVTEIGLRILMPQVLETTKDIYVSDPVLGYRLIPDLDRQLSESEWNIHLETNSKGYRDRDRTSEKAQESLRIVGIGDSFLFGFGVEYEEGLLTQLQQNLTSSNPENRKIETVNLGVPGYSTTQYGNLLKSEALSYSADLVIVLFYMNDFQSKATKTEFAVSKTGYLISTDDEGNPVEEEFGFGSIRSLLLPLRVFLKRNSHTYMFVRTRLSTLLIRAGLRPTDHPALYDKNLDISSTYQYTFDAIKAMQQICESNDTNFLLCVIPEKQQIDLQARQIGLDAYGLNDADYDWLQPQAAVVELCEQQGIECLDLVPAFEASMIDNRSPLFFDFDLHLTSAGHALVAAELAKRISTPAWLETLAKDSDSPNRQTAGSREDPPHSIAKKRTPPIPHIQSFSPGPSDQ